MPGLVPATTIILPPRLIAGRYAAPGNNEPARGATEMVFARFANGSPEQGQ